MSSAESSIQRTPGGVTVTFGESASGPKTVLLDGVSYSSLLRAQGWKDTTRWNHGTPELRVVAWKQRWEKDGNRCFTSYRVRDDVPIPLLNAMRVAKAEEVWLSESHSDADALLVAGVIGTTNWGSASEWNKEYADQLRGKQLVIVQHKDAAGRSFVKMVRASLRDEDVTVVEAAVGNDARDHLEAGLGLADFVEVV